MAGLAAKSRLRGLQVLATWIDHSPSISKKRTAHQAENGTKMSVRHTLFAATTLSILALAMSPASSQTLRYANQGELKSLDPYTLKETTTIAHLGHAYERLVTRDKDLKIIPALAE